MTSTLPNVVNETISTLPNIEKKMTPTLSDIVNETTTTTLPNIEKEMTSTLPNIVKETTLKPPDIVKETYLTANLVGRIGNQMFIYASIYALAKMNKKTPIIDSNKRATINYIFQLTMKVENLTGTAFKYVSVFKLMLFYIFDNIYKYVFVFSTKKTIAAHTHRD
jgi:hypothetical protein